MNSSRLRLSWIAAIGLVLAFATSAEATSIPADITIYSANITYSTSGGDNFTASCANCLLQWVDSQGVPGVSLSGTLSLNYQQSTNNYSFSLLDGINTLLAGTVIGFNPNVFSPGPGATFAGMLALSSSSLGFGSAATYSFSSFDFVAGVGTAEGRGTADADITAIPSIPEPTTIALLGTGSVVLALKRRRLRRKSQPAFD